jgi:uroporphyrinogen decarboxylase
MFIIGVKHIKNKTMKNLIYSIITILTLNTSLANAQGLNNTFSNKRELILSVLDQSKPNEYVPAAFFLHFDNKLGAKAVQDHINFFRATNMDIVKVFYEILPPHVDIKSPTDWKKVKELDENYFAPQVAVVQDLARELKNEALIIPTVYSPLAVLHQVAGNVDIVKLIKQDPEAVRPALENITKSIENYLRAARKHGADGFYISSQGGDTKSFGQSKIFNDIIRPYDKRVSETAQKLTPINILHICDYGSSYTSIDGYADYPASIINPPIHLEKGEISLKHVQEVFKRPVFGGLDRLGVIATGTVDEAKAAVDEVLKNAPQNFILGADCTIPSNTDVDKLRSIIDYTHTWRQTHNSDGTLK